MERKCIALVFSSKGNIFRYALKILQKYESGIDFVIIVDRDCEAKKIAIENNFPLHEIYDDDNHGFSVKCKEILDSYSRIDLIITFFHRLLTNALLDEYPCVNIHPAILPSFAGFNAIDRAMEKNVKFIGATLHVIDEKIDHGTIIAQTCFPVRSEMTKYKIYDSVFVQEVYLTLLIIDLVIRDEIKVTTGNSYELYRRLPFTDRFNPCIENEKFIAELRYMEKERNINILGEHIISYR